jgi:hypothetical protein
MELRLHKLRYLHLVSARNYLGESFFMLLQVAFYLFPLLLAGFSLQSSKRLLIGVALLPVLAAFLWWFFGETIANPAWRDLESKRAGDRARPDPGESSRASAG